MTGGGAPLPVADWARCERVEAAPGTTVHVGPLLRLRDDGVAEERSADTLFLPWPQVARLTPHEVRSLGLPLQADFSLELRGSGAIVDADFEIACGFVHRDGRRVVAPERRGAWLRVGGVDYLLPDPLYTIVERIDHFPDEGAGVEGRMLAWGRIDELLPEGALVDDHLRSLHITVASCFTLRPFINDRGEPDFDPQLGHHVVGLNEYQEEERRFEECLPPARQRDFAQRFRGLARVKHRYAAGAGTFVMLTPELEHGLGAVRRAQQGTPAERRDFLLNASGYLRAALAEGDAGDVELDAVFHDEGLSERVEGIGLWVPKVLPWVKRAKEPWLPPEEFGLKVGDQTLRLAAEEVSSLLDSVRAARAGGDGDLVRRYEDPGNGGNGRRPRTAPAGDPTGGREEGAAGDATGRGRAHRSPDRGQPRRASLPLQEQGTAAGATGRYPGPPQVHPPAAPEGGVALAPGPLVRRQPWRAPRR
jgi:hypothetical protein